MQITINRLARMAFKEAYTLADKQFPLKIYTNIIKDEVLYIYTASINAEIFYKKHDEILTSLREIYKRDALKTKGVYFKKLEVKTLIDFKEYKKRKKAQADKIFINCNNYSYKERAKGTFINPLPKDTRLYHIIEELRLAIKNNATRDF